MHLIHNETRFLDSTAAAAAATAIAFFLLLLFLTSTMLSPPWQANSLNIEAEGWRSKVMYLSLPSSIRRFFCVLRNCITNSPSLPLPPSRKRCSCWIMWSVIQGESAFASGDKVKKKGHPAEREKRTHKQSYWQRTIFHHVLFFSSVFVISLSLFLSLHSHRQHNLVLLLLLSSVHEYHSAGDDCVLHYINMGHCSSGPPVHWEVFIFLLSFLPPFMEQPECLHSSLNVFNWFATLRHTVSPPHLGCTDTNQTWQVASFIFMRGRKRRRKGFAWNSTLTAHLAMETDGKDIFSSFSSHQRGHFASQSAQKIFTWSNGTRCYCFSPTVPFSDTRSPRTWKRQAHLFSFPFSVFAFALTFLSLSLSLCLSLVNVRAPGSPFSVEHAISHLRNCGICASASVNW